MILRQKNQKWKYKVKLNALLSTKNLSIFGKKLIANTIINFISLYGDYQTKNRLQLSLIKES